MQVERVERSFEPCTESGWYGYYIHLAGPLSHPLVTALAPLGQLSYFQSLKRPFFTLRGPDFLLRGIVGDTFIKAGFSAKEAPSLAAIKAAIEAAPCEGSSPA